ncbi:hypothetical protein HC02_25890 [Vibrio parahaemolyticus]|nr:hypothetical protein HC02_25890 [Vibrio parahaemolyticus]
MPIYIAPILVFTIGWRVLARLILIAKREHITSIADFIGARYGKSQGLAVVVTLIAVAGILPYIALQLRGITMGLEIIAPELATDLVIRMTACLGLSWWHWPFLPCCLVLAILITPSITVDDDGDRV